MPRLRTKYRLLATVVLCTLFGLVYLGVMQAFHTLETMQLGMKAQQTSSDHGREKAGNPSIVQATVSVTRGEADFAVASERIDLYIFTLFAVSLVLVLAFLFRLERWYHRSYSRSFSKELYLDPLTGALNRRAGERDLARLFGVWKATGVNSAVYLLDIDDFKVINDTWGHDAGDLVLRRVVRQLYSVLRHSDKVYRWGGEELVVICEGVHAKNRRPVGEALLGAVAATSDLSIPSLAVTASVGMTVFFGTDTQYCQALKRADRAMYHAKRSGKNRLADHDVLQPPRQLTQMHNVA